LLNLDVNPGDNLGYYLYFFNDYENQLTKKIIELSKDYKVFFDVGANYGWISLAVANNCSSLDVYSFEPDKKIIQEFELNLNKNSTLKSNIKIVNKAIHDSVVEVRFIPSNQKNNPGIGRIDESETNNGYFVEATSLDSFCQKENVFPDIIKVDVEGAELKVVRGMSEMLSKGNPKILIIEIHGFYYGDKASDFNKEIISELIKYKYRIYVLDNNELVQYNEYYNDLRRMHIVAYSSFI